MSGIAGAKAISLVTSGKVRELVGRTFEVEGSNGSRYVVTVEVVSAQAVWKCTCPAGVNGRRCYHVDGARLAAKRPA
jgi:uncharacterized Zn finger protein